MTANLEKLSLKYWPLAYADMYRERAAILEYEANIERGRAEELAREIVIVLWKIENWRKEQQ